MKNKLFLLLLTLIASTTTSWAQEIRFYCNESRGYQSDEDHTTTNFADLKTKSQSTLDWQETITNSDVVMEVAWTDKITRSIWSTNAAEYFDWVSYKMTTPSYTRCIYTIGYWCKLWFQKNGLKMRFAYFDYGTDPNGYWQDRDKDPIGTTYFETAYNNYNGPTNGEFAARSHYSNKTPNWVSQYMNFPGIEIDNRNNDTDVSDYRYGGFSTSKATYSEVKQQYVQMTMGCTIDTYFYKYVTFNPNGGTGSSMAVQTVENSANLSQNTYTRPGYVFAGWKTKKQSTDVTYADQAEITATLESKGPVTLYAHWVKISTTDADGGVIYNEDATVTPADVEAMLNDPETETIPVVDLSKATVTTADATTIVNNIRGNEKGKNAFIILPAGTDISNLPTTDNVNIIIGNVCENLYLIDQTPMESSVQNRHFTANNATYYRAQGNEWGTVCLPFALQSDTYIQYYTLATVSGSSMWFNPIQTVEKNTPVVFRRIAGNEINVSDTNAPIYVNGTDTKNTDATNWQLKGTYKPITISNNNPKLFYIAQNQFWQATQAAHDVNVPAYRAYFETTTPVSARSFTLFIGDGDNTTEIGTINADGTIETAPVYNIAGQRLSTTTKGINIINGKKIIK